MGEKRNLDFQTLVARRSAPPRRRPPGEARPDSLDWTAWTALIERHRRAISRNGAKSPDLDDYIVRATCRSFTLDGIQTTEQEIVDAVTQLASQRKFRSRPAQRIRNHVAILMSIEQALRRGDSLKPAVVLRWYTSISSGLALNALTDERMARIEQTVGRINSPQLRLQPALMEISRLYSEMLADPMFPSFNGILCRLLLRYHLGRCALPFIVFENTGVQNGSSEQEIALQLLSAMDESYQMLLG